MKINLNTRIKALLDENREPVINSLVKLNSNFSKLRNPILRNLLARRVTIAEACKIAKCNPADFLNSMKAIGFVVDEAMNEPIAKKGNAIDFSRQTAVFELDVRPFLTKDQDPLKEILKRVNQLGVGERLKIINTFEPIPLINLLADKGFLYATETVNDELIITWFEKTAQESTAIDEPQEIAQQHTFNKVFNQFQPDKIKYIDVRKLEMPQPLLRIMEQIENLNADELLYVYHKKTPVFLLPELRKKGLTFLLNQKATDQFDMLIYKV